MLFSVPVALAICALTGSPLANHTAIGNPAISRHSRIISKNASELKLEFSSNDLEVRTTRLNSEAVCQFNLPEEGVMLRNGLPDLPAISRFVQVPPRAGVSLSVRADRSESLPVPHLLFASGSSISDLNEIASTQSKPRLYPSSIVELGAPVIVRGVRMVQVTVYPIQYDRLKREFIHHQNIEVSLQFDTDEPINPVEYTSPRRNRSIEFDNVLKSLCLNGVDLARDDNEPSSEYQGHYLVVAREECLPFAIPLIEWKRETGFKVDILSYPVDVAEDTADVRQQVQSDIQALYDGYLEQEIDPFEYILILGDRGINLGETQWVFESHAGIASIYNTNHADYQFGLLEGDDQLMDVGVGRLNCGNKDMMELAVTRTLSYESAPDTDDPGWFGRAGVFAQHWGEDWNPSLNQTARWGEAVVKRLGFTDIRVQNSEEYDQSGAIIGPVLAEWFNGRVGLMLGRAENFYWLNNFQGVDDNVVFPIFINICGHGENVSQNMFRTGDRDHLKGPVALTTGWGNPQTIKNNGFWLALVKGVLVHDMSLGWARSYAGMVFPTLFPSPNDTTLIQYQTDSDLSGDPGLKPWIREPIQVSLSHPDQIPARVNSLEVTVHIRGSREPIPNAWVALYLPGELPDPDAYAGWTPHYAAVCKTDTEGNVRFSFNQELAEGAMKITVTGRNLYPRQEEITVSSMATYVTLDHFTLEVGGRETLNPGDTATLTLFALNSGSETAATNLTADISSESPSLEVRGGSISFRDLNPGDIGQGLETAEVIARPSCPDGSDQKLKIQFHCNQGDWDSYLGVPVAAPMVELNGLVPDSLPFADTIAFDIVIKNIGHLALPACNAELDSQSWGVRVLTANAEYPALEIGASASSNGGSGYKIVVDPTLIPGVTVPMMLVVTSGNDRKDSVRFEIKLGAPEANSPQGPDEYGYICYDNTDVGYTEAPSYQWIEISNYDGDPEFAGDLVGELDNANDLSFAVSMPFPLRFYGETFDSITICSNGFIAPGNQTRAITLQNYPMDLAMGGGAGMIAPYWDDLRLIFEQFGSVWYYYDQAENRLIVEWYKAVQISDTNQVTFEVIIYDTQARPTATDDCSILFQYKSIHTILGGGGDMPYASVGISSPDGKTGLSYCFRNVYPITSDTLRNRRAILYQTLPSLHSSGAEMELAPTQWEMIGSFPNPFNSNTTITYSLPTTKRTVIEVFDLRGRKVQTLLDALQPAGSHNVEFPAGGIPSGIYICRLQSGELTATRKLVLLR